MGSSKFKRAVNFEERLSLGRGEGDSNFGEWQILGRANFGEPQIFGSDKFRGVRNFGEPQWESENFGEWHHF